MVYPSSFPLSCMYPPPPAIVIPFGLARMTAQEIEKSITILPVCGDAIEKEAADRMSAALAPNRAAIEAPRLRYLVVSE